MHVPYLSTFNCVFFTLQEAHSREVKELKRDHSRAVEELERRHALEMRTAEERLSAEKAAWQENYTRRQETSFMTRETEN